MKTIVLLRRRADLSRDAFRRYYEDQHVPLAIKHVRFSKYVRNHLIAPSNAPYDVATEFWPEDPVAATTLLASPAGEIFRREQANFMASERFRAIAEESLLAGPPRTIERGRVYKYALLLERPAYAAEADFLADSRDWGRRLAAAAKAKRVTIDFVKPFPGYSFPANAILWLWLGRAFDVGLTERPPKSVKVGAILTLDAFETPPGQLTLVQ